MMREEELTTLYQEELKTLPFKTVIEDFLGHMVPDIFRDGVLVGIIDRASGKLLVNERVRLKIDPHIVIAGYLINFTRIVDERKIPYDEIVKEIAKAADSLNDENVPILPRSLMDWQYF